MGEYVVWGIWGSVLLWIIVYFISQPAISIKIPKDRSQKLRLFPANDMVETKKDWVALFQESLLADDDYLHQLARQQIKAQNFYLARIVIDRISSDSAKHLLLIAFADQLIECNDLLSAQKVLESIENKSGFSVVWESIVTSYLRITRALLRHSEYQWARQTLGKAVAIMTRVEGTTLETARLKLNIGQLFHQMSEFTQAFEHWQAALEDCRNLRNSPDDRTHLNCRSLYHEVLSQFVQSKMVKPETRVKLHKMLLKSKSDDIFSVTIDEFIQK